MVTDPEAQTQLARLLRDPTVRSADEAALADAVDNGFDTVVTGLVAEAAASDDVTGRESAEAFVKLRLDALAGVLTPAQASRLYEAVRAKIEAW